jgi:hypothetical protein
MWSKKVAQIQVEWEVGQDAEMKLSLVPKSKKMDDPISIAACLRLISNETVSMQAVSEMRCNVYFYGVSVGMIQRLGSRWAHFTSTHDRKAPTQFEAAESLVRWRLSQQPDVYLSRLKAALKKEVAA